MIVLDEPYVSDPLVDWLEQSQHPVLDNAVAAALATEGRRLNLVGEDEASRRIEAGERVYTNSENALAWVVDHAGNAPLARAIDLFKDKAAMRRALAGLDPDLFFKTCSIDELFKLDFARLPAPFVLKPSVGFCSVGVYAVADREDWERALADIQKNAASWHDLYPESVIGAGSFILEGYIDGARLEEQVGVEPGQRAAHGRLVLEQVDGARERRVARMYVTSAAIVRDNAPAFAAWLDKVNALVGARNFPVHVEVRVDEGHVCPIEFNPLRFAGLGGTDVSWYAYGYRTYEAFLEGVQPDFGAAFAGKEGKVYSMSLLNAPDDATGDERFDYEALRDRFSQVLALRPFDVRRTGTYGFLFLETDAETADELDFLKNTDLKEFLR